ncbi:hypothetical protein ABBQ38_010040 [Trebouxia sp. C0009 RCD-2024]
MSTSLRLCDCRPINSSLYGSGQPAQARHSRPRWSINENARFKRKAYTSSDEEGDLDADEKTWDTDEGNWGTDDRNCETENSHHFQQAEPAFPDPVVDSKGGLWKTGGIALAVVAFLFALFVWYTKSKRQRPTHVQHSERREAPASEADLDNTVRTLTEQRLSDGLSDAAMQGVSVRQPSLCSWQPHGVGYASCDTTTRYYHTRPVAAEIISGPAAVELLRLQVEYLVFLKQSDAIQALAAGSKPTKYIKL